MNKHFTTSGPVVPSKHYCIDPMQRLDWEEIRYLIDAEKYFVLHAPRQTGKTSTLLAMMEVLNQSGEYNTLYVNIEGAQTAREDADKGMTTVCQTIAARARDYGIEPTLPALAQSILEHINPGTAITELLSRWAQLSPKPIVLMLDEVDTLIGDTLISLLRQIRAGYAQRPRAFPQSIILCGVRDTGGSAFNIKAESLCMGNFSLAEVKLLYQQHTDATGQIFDEAVFPALWEDTQGQPWLVNALGHEMTWKDKTARDRSTLITQERYQAARERLIRSRATHLDQLTNQLKERRVHAVIAALLAGESRIANLQNDDLQYVEDLGLIRTSPQIAISNRIYQEIIPREITWQWQATITHQQAWYLTPERRLDMVKLLTAFQQFFRENSDVWLQGLPYKEAGPHLILQAFLQRIVNGGGRIHREYALGRKYTDLYLEWPLDEVKGFYGEVQRVVLELKILYANLDKTIADGLSQVGGYARHCGATEAHLVIFNRNPDVSWDEKTWHEVRHDAALQVEVWGA
ncbi:AAA-like domain-containing protein [Thiothrix litoralis]|uniref:AAA-like domain-containing protein n=1 Tax=Thiothrix litoralis TaxID=2891210 RepID=A0ABX7WR42_9GAMM|nr:AAA-like domain-containing protein [Thiothrix litoralis]QTR44823.1 AAA-like domain-containing protein [Thiothrix litoralis]